MPLPGGHMDTDKGGKSHADLQVLADPRVDGERSSSL
jgi:hypothetical protein